MASSSKAKGKSQDMSTDWSPWEWNKDSSCWYSTRLNASGDREYDYRYPEGTPQDTIPRTPGPLTSSPESQRTSYGSSYAMSPAYTTYDSAGSQNLASSENLSPASGVASQSPAVGYSTSPGGGYGSTPGSLTEGLGKLSLGTSAAIPEEGQFMGHIKRAPGSADSEGLDPRYRVIPDANQKKFWRQGRVFIMLWTEPARDDSVNQTRNGTHYSRTYLNTEAFSEIRRFVVIREGHGNSLCSPIHTYNGQATLKRNLPAPQEHAIIYTSKNCPEEHSYKAADGTIVRENLTKLPIKVKSQDQGPEGQLHPLSRINYSKIYTVEHYVRVLNIGLVEKDWLPILDANCLVRPTGVGSHKPVSNPPPETRRDDKGKRKGSGSDSGHKHHDRGESSSHRHRRK